MKQQFQKKIAIGSYEGHDKITELTMGLSGLRKDQGGLDRKPVIEN